MADINLMGKNSILFIHDDTAYLPIVCLTGNSTNEEVAVNDGTVTKCNQDPTPILGVYTYTKDFEGIAIEDQATKLSLESIRQFLREKAVAKEPVFWKEEITLANATKVTEYGKAYLTNISYDAPADGEMTFKGTLNGIGYISTTDLKTV